VKNLNPESATADVNRFNETLYGVSHGGTYFTVAFLPGRIALCGNPGHQFFLNTGNLPAERLHEVFTDERSYQDRAILHKETATDQQKFLASIDELLAEKLIDVHSKRVLREFILKCDCPPRRIRDKLRAMGYAHILPRLQFERYPDELETTIAAMRIFVEGVKKVTFDEPVPQQRRSRQRASRPGSRVGV
jgi:hypothetical protein